MTYDGAPTGQERNLLKATWDSKGEKIAAGSGDQSVAIWEARTGKLLNKLPGHKGTVNDVRFHPLDEPISKYQIFSTLTLLLFLFHNHVSATLPVTALFANHQDLEPAIVQAGAVFSVFSKASWLRGRSGKPSRRVFRWQSKDSEAVSKCLTAKYKANLASLSRLCIV